MEKHPETIDNPTKFFIWVLTERYPWVSDLPDQQWNDIEEFCGDLLSLARRRLENTKSITP
jgi:hypothetical protein